MGLGELVGNLAKATFWGAMLILALLTIYFWFFTVPVNIFGGIVTLLLTIGFGWLGHRMN